MAKRICVALAAALVAAGAQAAHADDTIKIGFIAPSTDRKSVV